MDLPALPPIAHEPISVALPVRDQQPVLSVAVTAWCDYLDRLNRPYELLVVDDGSRDATAATLTELAARYPSLKVLTHAEPRGFGAALATALASAQHPLFFYTDLDFPYAPGELRKLLDCIDKAHLVNGLRGDRQAPPWSETLAKLHRLFSRVVFGVTPPPTVGWFGVGGTLYRWLNVVLFGVRLRDIDSSFKLFRRSVFARLPVQSRGEFAHAEILAKANFQSALMDEVVIGTRPGPFPALPRPKRGRLGDFLRVFFKPDFGKYAPEPTPAPAA